MVMINKGSIQTNCTDLMDLKQPIQNAQGFIQPSIEVGPKTSSIVKNASSASTGNTTVYTTPLDQDFYLTAAQLTTTQNVTSDGIDTSITVVIGGATLRILSLSFQGVTVCSKEAQLSFSYPLKLDRGTGIVLGGTFTVGAQTKRAMIMGYLL